MNGRYGFAPPRATLLLRPLHITNEQWQRIAEFIPEPRARPDKSGRPPQDARSVLNGILWILRTGAPWKDLPERYPPRSTCHRRFQEWTRSGVFDTILAALAEDLRDRGGRYHLLIVDEDGAAKACSRKRYPVGKVLRLADRLLLGVAMPGRGELWRQLEKGNLRANARDRALHVEV